MQQHMRDNPVLFIGYVDTGTKDPAKLLECDLLLRFERDHGPPWAAHEGRAGRAIAHDQPLDQVDGDNFNRLTVAWTWRSADEELTKANPRLKTWVWESTPLMVGGVLYVTPSSPVKRGTPVKVAITSAIKNPPHGSNNIGGFLPTADPRLPVSWVSGI